MEFRFAERLRVRWVEVDLQRIVFNGHYLMYFDTAVAGWWRALALPYGLTMAALQGDLYVRKATVEYEASARYDEQIEVGIRCARIGNSSITLQAAVFRAGERLVHGEIVYVFADPVTQTSRPVPQGLRDVLLGFEAGEPVLQWIEDSQPLDASAVADEEGRTLNFPPAAIDEGLWHVGARNRLGLTVASGRLRWTGAGTACIDHLAVRPSLQGSGIGRSVLSSLLKAAVQRGADRVEVSSLRGAVRFFSSAGFASISDGDTGQGEASVQMRWCR
jgi:YbgC/YbaW family acyl-CoA thioester hydrolase